ncbi:MAG: hypothetical protein EOP83_34520 [Verrucomicrobiaceae bacterium]|nr:MAG: hypothetical protein EOP83_34520 [Verrucomicrobiaceae bacterium]
MDFDTINKATACIHEGLLNRMTEDERNQMLASVHSISVPSFNTVGRTASKGTYGVQGGTPTVVYEMSKEAYETWAPRIDGMTNRIPGTATIIHLKLKEGAPGVLA